MTIKYAVFVNSTKFSLSFNDAILTNCFQHGVKNLLHTSKPYILDKTKCSIHK